MRHLLGEDYDAYTGMTTRYYSLQEADGKNKIVIQRLQDVEENFNANKAEYNSHSDHAATRYKSDNPIHKVASIPYAVIEKWMREDGFNVFTASDAELRRRLNDGDYKKLRTMGGKL